MLALKGESTNALVINSPEPERNVLCKLNAPTPPTRRHKSYLAMPDSGSLLAVHETSMVLQRSSAPAPNDRSTFGEGIGGVVSGHATGVPDTGLLKPDTLFEVSTARTRYEYDVPGVTGISTYEVPAMREPLSGTAPPLRYTLYPATATLSVDAVHAIRNLPHVLLLTDVIEGVVGGAMSPTGGKGAHVVVALATLLRADSLFALSTAVIWYEKVVSGVSPESG